MNRLILICLSYFLSLSTVFSQIEKPQNYRKFDQRLLHFGFTLGTNTADFTPYPVLDAYEKYGILSIDNKRQPGGQVGIVTSLKLGHPVVRLRFIPTLSFQERLLSYVYEDPAKSPSLNKINEERVNSTNLDFPLMLQFRTTRFNNFTSYVLGGIQYSLDLQSQEDAAQSFTDPFVKIRKEDWQGQIGGGVEFFMPYFKLGIELKFSHSFSNVMINDFTPVSRPVDKMYNRVWWFSLIFEG
jgi:hypothetical protein